MTGNSHRIRPSHPILNTHETLRTEALHQVLHQAPHQALRTEALHEALHTEALHDGSAYDGSAYDGSTTEALYKSVVQSFV